MAGYPPYAEYKESGVEWLGEVPKHWNIVRLKHLAFIRNGKDYKDVVADEGYPVIGSGGKFAVASEYLYEGESVLLGRKGTIDRPLYIDGAFWTVDTMFYTEVNPSVSAKHLYYCALTINFGRYVTSTALPSMTQQNLGDIQFSVPKLEEQQTIARFLDHKTVQIDALIAKKEALLEKLAEKRIALISHAVTKGLDPQAKMKDSGVEWLGELPEHWNIVRLKHLAFIRNGKDYKDVVADEGYPVIGSGGKFAVASEYLYEGESVLLGRKGTIDRPLYIDGAFWTVDTMFYTEVNPSVSAKYLYYCALTINFGRYVTSTALPSMTQQNLGDIQFSVPKLEEQQTIARFLDHKTAQIDALIAKKTDAIEKLKEYRSALITQAVTGKIDVRQVPLPQALRSQPMPDITKPLHGVEEVSR